MSDTAGYQSELIETRVRAWLSRVVVGLNLCPFARKPLEGGRVKVTVSTARDTETLLEDLRQALSWLDARSPEQTETTLLVVPHMLEEFLDYYYFLSLADDLLKREDWEGRFQIASFHPDYRFAYTAPDAPENYSNRSPWPVLHLLREDSVALAVEGHPAPESIPQRNVEALNGLGSVALAAMLEECRRAGSSDV